ncbi:MAG: hypothetical protein RLZZ416_763 [Candidatus Parcubacteria bacterium]|jgi:membrane protein DedA with SNARE-associated domain
MDADHITQLLLQYRYLILLPLSIFEGPVAAVAAGALASLGYFNVLVLALFFFLIDMAKDAFYYSLGYWGGNTRIVHNLLKKLGLHGHLDHIRHLWDKHAGKTMFLGKLSYGIASSFVVLAGTIKMPLKKFFGWGAAVAVAQYWTLLAIGYFFGNAVGSATTHIIDVLQWLILGITVSGIVYYIFGVYMRKEFEREAEE